MCIRDRSVTLIGKILRYAIILSPSLSIKVTAKKALDYITNPDKTDEKLLVSSFGCSPETADLEFSMTREMAKKNGMDKGDNLAFHLDVYKRQY